MEVDFKKLVEGKRGCAVILAGSDSDGPHIEAIIASLEEYGIPYQVRICSAHKDPSRLMELIQDYNRIDGALAYVAVAGGTDALSGTLAFHALNPVISCPPDGLNESCLRNPPGSANATIVNPKNLGKFIAQMYAPSNPEYRSRLMEHQERKIHQLQGADREFLKRYRRS